MNKKEIKNMIDVLKSRVDRKMKIYADNFVFEGAYDEIELINKGQWVLLKDKLTTKGPNEEPALGITIIEVSKISAITFEVLKGDKWT